MSSESPRIAIVTDWLTNMGGGERVVLAMHEAFPDAPIYTSVYEPSKMPLFKDCDIRTTWLQKLPRPVRSLHRFFPMLRVKAFRDLDLSEYDIILSSSSAEAKQVRKTREGQVHICYCHTPIRYYWSHYDEYKKNPGFGALNWVIRLAMPFFVPPLKKADYAAAQDVDVFIANSEEVRGRIKKYYNRTSTIVYPPVDYERYAEAMQPRANRIGYVALGRQVPYKRIDLAVAACTQLKLPLTVVGRGGPEHERLKAMAGPTVSFETNADDDRVARILGDARGFIFPAEEDFGIVQVEALAAGTPVIGFGKGGTVEIVGKDGGVIFKEQTVESVVDAIIKAEKIEFKPEALQRIAKRYHKTLFISKLQKIVGDHLPS